MCYASVVICDADVAQRAKAVDPRSDVARHYIDVANQYTDPSRTTAILPRDW